MNPTMRVDYTTKPIGARLSQAGTIAICPVCGRNGERRAHSAKTKPWIFVHEAEVTAHAHKPLSTKLVQKCASPSAGETPLANGEGNAAEPQQGVLGR